MQTNKRVKALLMGVFAATSWASAQQFTQIGTSGWWRTNPTTPDIGRGVAIGNLTATPYPAAFQIHGELMPAGNNTPEVFRTNAPTTGSTYWRMFQGGTGAGNERGQLFADPSATHFNINAPQGHLRLLTNTTERMRVNQSGSYTIGSFAAQLASGFVGVSPNSTLWTGGNPGPFSRLHLHDGTSVQSSSYRPWMKNGLTITGNQDHGFLGQKAGAVDFTDMVLHWSDNPGVTLKDRLRFIFTSGYSSAATSGAQSTEGLEAMRIFPIRYDEAYVGIGDFYAANLANPSITEPTERVDMVNGRMRIRQLPNDAEHTGPYKVMVVDDSPAPSAERGVVKWRTLPTNPGGADCDWTLLGTGNANIATAYAGNPGCPQYDRFVGIGTNAPVAKLDVRWTGTAGVAYASNFAIDGSSYAKRGAEFSASGTGSLHAGLRALASGASGIYNLEGNMAVHARAEGTVNVASNRGLFSEALVTGSSTVGRNMGLEVVSDGVAGTTMTENYGVLASARALGASTDNYGGHFYSWTSNSTSTNYGVKGVAEGGCLNYGVYAQAPEATEGCDRWALYVNGAQFSTTSDVFTTSDESLKSDIALADVGEAADLLAGVRLHTYAFNTAENPQLHLPSGQQLGVLAAELEEVLPRLVRTVHQPSGSSATGAEALPGLEFKAVSYTGLIPYLIAGHQAQQTEMDELRAQLSELQAQLASCCSNAGGTDQRLLQSVTADEHMLDARTERLLRIAPNPFTDRTTLYYTTERSGRVQLLANSADGRDLRVLSEAQREAGDFQYEWSTADLAPGVYYITLLLDGEPVVKRAVKVGR